MASWIVALLVGLGAGAWTWNKAMKETSRNDTSIIIAVVVGVIVFLVLFTLIKFVI